MSVPDHGIQRRYRVRVSLFLLAVCIVLVGCTVGYQAFRTLQVLDVVERQRDGWQQAGPVIAALNLKDGSVVADVGAGAGYFSLKLATAVGDKGRVLAEDILREPLAFLWIRARLRHRRNIQIVHGEPENPHLPDDQVDAVLVANTYHEFAHPRAMLKRVLQALHTGGRLVIVDRGPLRGEEESREADHERDPAEVEIELQESGFELIERNDRFIDRPPAERPGDRPDNHTWWLMVAKKQ